MKSIIELGQRGGEHLGTTSYMEADTPVQAAAFTEGDQRLQQLIGTVRRFPNTRIEAEGADGIKHTIGVHTMPLHNARVFGLAHQLATYEPIVYANIGGRRAMGMLSNNYDTTGTNRQPGLKVIPLQTPYPLTSKLSPDARMGTMLAGAVSAERQGVGKHEGGAAKDFEHQATILGALSVGRPGIARSHANHAIRESSSIATGLTNGSLGNLYAPDRTVSDFPGYGTPLTIAPDQAAPTDALYIPENFLDSPEAWGGTYVDASRLMLGAGLQALYERQGAGAIQTQYQQLAGEL